MNTLQKIHKAFNAPNERLFLPNVYTPPKGLTGLKVAKTIQPSEHATFNEVYKNAKECLLK